MRIVQYAETVLFEPYRHILGKAGTSKKEPAVVADSLRQRWYIDTERMHGVKIENAAKIYRLNNIQDIPNSANFLACTIYAPVHKKYGLQPLQNGGGK